MSRAHARDHWGVRPDLPAARGNERGVSARRRCLRAATRGRMGFVRGDHGLAVRSLLGDLGCAGQSLQEPGANVVGHSTRSRAPYSLPRDLWWIPAHRPRVCAQRARIPGCAARRVRPVCIGRVRVGAHVFTGWPRDAAAVCRRLRGRPSLRSSRGRRGVLLQLRRASASWSFRAIRSSSLPCSCLRRARRPSDRIDSWRPSCQRSSPIVEVGTETAATPR